MAWDDSASKIWMDGNMVDWKDAKIHALSHVVHYGTSVFCCCFQFFRKGQLFTGL